MDINERVKHVAEAMIKAGYGVIPISQTSKSPIVKWKQLIESRLTEWNFKGVNIAMLTGAENGYVVVDCDSKESYIGWLKHRPGTPLKVKTKKGMHFYYRHPGKYVMSNSKIQAKEGFLYDVKGDRSYALMPPSINDWHQYQVCVCRGNLEGKWLSSKHLPMFDPAWRPVTEYSHKGINSGAVKDAYKVLNTITATEGERDFKTYHATMVCIDAGLGEAEAMEAVLAWHQTNVTPPWHPLEIATKVRRVYSERVRQAG